MQTMRKPVKYWKTNSLEIKISEMASNQKQQSRKPAEGEAKGKVEEGLPMKGSPYLQYDNLEDYKRQAYGTEGHQQVEPGRGAGSTEAPTVSGTTVSSQVADSEIYHNGVTNKKLLKSKYILLFVIGDDIFSYFGNAVSQST
ncbi:unnamed protein product [Malus baccata var. baccata]